MTLAEINYKLLVICYTTVNNFSVFSKTNLLVPKFYSHNKPPIESDIYATKNDGRQAVTRHVTVDPWSISVGCPLEW